MIRRDEVYQTIKTDTDLLCARQFVLEGILDYVAGRIILQCITQSVFVYTGAAGVAR